jgi:hypothetical protein
MSKSTRLISIVALTLGIAIPSIAVAQRDKFEADRKKFEAQRKTSAAKGKRAGKSVPKNQKKKGRKPTLPEQSPVDKALTEHALSADQLDALVGKDVNLLRNDGKRFESVKVLKFATGKDKSCFKSVSVEGESGEKARPRNFTGKSLFRIEVDKKPYDVRLVPSQKAYALIDVEKHKEAVKSQLETNGFRLWEPLSQEKLDRYVEEERKFLLEVKEHFSQLPMHEKESRYFLFLTDMPPNQIGPYLAQLDAMNEKLGEAFGFEPGQNVWRGKAVIVAFVNEEDFKEFETTFMKGPAPDNVQGICHTEPNGRVVVSLHRGDDPEFFAAVLVHETSHGYMHRYKSNKSITRWLNEGIADWIAGVIVPESNEVGVRQQAAVQHLQNQIQNGQAPSLEGLFDGRVPEAWQYGVGSTIVDVLVSQDKDAFRLFFDGIKEGLTWEDSLQRAYGATRADLLALYGQAVGIENLEP